MAALTGSQPVAVSGADAGGPTARLADAQQRLRRYQAAIGAGVDPVAMVDAINQAQAERAAARAEIDNAPASTAVDAAAVYAMIDAMGDIGATIGDAKPAGLARLYRELDIGARYEPAERAVYLTAEPRVDSAGVRGGTCTLTTRLTLA